MFIGGYMAFLLFILVFLGFNAYAADPESGPVSPAAPAAHIDQPLNNRAPQQPRVRRGQNPPLLGARQQNARRRRFNPLAGHPLNNARRNLAPEFEYLAQPGPENAADLNNQERNDDRLLGAVVQLVAAMHEVVQQAQVQQAQITPPASPPAAAGPLD